MQIKNYTISVHDDGTQCEAMNSFMRGHQVLQIHREFVSGLNSTACWCFCIEYEEGAPRGSKSRTLRKKVDYKEVLDEATFSVFSCLRKARKEIAELDEVPAYAVFTDEQLAGIAKLKELTPSAMRQVNGIGDGKVDKYAERMLNILTCADKKVKESTQL